MILIKDAEGNPFTLVCPKMDGTDKIVLREVSVRGERYYSPHLTPEGGIAAYYQAYSINDPNAPRLSGDTFQQGVFNLHTTNSSWYNIGGEHVISKYDIDGQRAIGWCSADKYTTKIRGPHYDEWDKYFHRKNYSFDFTHWNEGTGTPPGGFVLDADAPKSFTSTYTHETLMAISGDVVPIRSTRLFWQWPWNGYTPDTGYELTSSNDINERPSIVSHPSPWTKTTCGPIYTSFKNKTLLTIQDSSGVVYYVWKIATTSNNPDRLELQGPFANSGQCATTNPIYILSFLNDKPHFIAKILYERVSFSRYVD